MKSKDLVVGLEHTTCPGYSLLITAMEKLCTKAGTMWRQKAGIEGRPPEPR